MTDTGMTSGLRLLVTRRATSAWFVLLAATLLIAPHTADLQALAAPAAAPPEPSDIPQPAAEARADTTSGPTAGTALPATQTPRYVPGGRRSVLVAGGDYADFPGRAGHGFAPRAWICPDTSPFFPPQGTAQRMAGTGAGVLQDAASARLLDRGPPA